MRIPPQGSAAKQIAYAHKSFGAENGERRKIALEVGYSRTSANSIISKIESKKGYLNAMGVLVEKSNNLAISIFDEFKRRDISEFTNKELISSLGTISIAMDRFCQRMEAAEAPPPNPNGNRLRTIVLQNITKQVNTPAAGETAIISPGDNATPVEFEEVEEDKGTEEKEESEEDSEF